MDPVRIGVIGVGGMGGSHARGLAKGLVPGGVLAAVCDTDAKVMKAFADAEHFTDAQAMYRSGAIDAVLIATPHYAHTPLTIAAFNAGLHVLCEKPMAVHKSDCEKMLRAYREELVFSIMFQQRLSPVMQKMKEMVAGGELGRITRVNWIITDWFRTDAYYARGGWRGTWAGEGGGVLLNQCPHNLDLFQWICGMPSRVQAFVGMGKWHRKIEVEDEVTAYLEFPDGATGVFVTSTGEAPGTNRFEICGEHGQLVAEGGRLRFRRNRVSSLKTLRTSKEVFCKPEAWDIELPLSGGDTGHTGIMCNFVNAIRDGAALIAPGLEGGNQVELGNAMIYSGVTGKPVDLPMSGAAYARLLKKLIANGAG